jgi:hypothetical protein
MTCEKCLKTATGLTLEGMEPSVCGFNIRSNFFPKIKKAFLNGKLPMNLVEEHEWWDIQKNIPPNLLLDYKGSKAFFEWFRSFDFSRKRKSSTRQFLWASSLAVERLSKIVRTRGNVLAKVHYLRWLTTCYMYLIFAKFRQRVL